MRGQNLACLRTNDGHLQRHVFRSYTQGYENWRRHGLSHEDVIKRFDEFKWF
jgi:hypothetical protein